MDSWKLMNLCRYSNDVGLE